MRHALVTLDSLAAAVHSSQVQCVCQSGEAADSCGLCSSVSAVCELCRQLVAAWVAVVQDYAVLGTHGPLVQAAYTPRLFPAPSLSIIARLQPNLQSCWPAALTALAVTLPQVAGEQTL